MKFFIGFVNRLLLFLQFLPPSFLDSYISLFPSLLTSSLQSLFSSYLISLFSSHHLLISTPSFLFIYLLYAFLPAILLTWLTADILNSSSSSATISLWRTTDPGNFDSGKGFEFRIKFKVSSIPSLSVTVSKLYLLCNIGLVQPVKQEMNTDKIGGKNCTHKTIHLK